MNEESFDRSLGILKPTGWSKKADTLGGSWVSAFWTTLYTAGDIQACISANKHIVHVVYIEKPTCEANATEVQDGDYVGLTCNMTFSGNGKPGMDWFAGEELLTSDDNSVVSKLRSDAARSVTTDDDRRPFRCIATLGNLQQVCDVTVEVPRESSSLVYA